MTFCSYILDKEGWATEKELTISYPRDVYNGYSYQYSLDLGVSWELYEQPLKITENNTIVVARVLDGDNIKVAASFTVSKIDKTIPTISLDGLPSIFSKDLSFVKWILHLMINKMPYGLDKKPNRRAPLIRYD